MIYILGGSYSQAIDYMRFKGLTVKTAKILESPRDLRALLKIRITAIGSWYTRDDIHEFEEAALSRQMSIIEDASW